MIFVGCCGIPKSFEKYLKEFNVVELNSTFYKFPRLKTVKKWREKASKDFVFCVKVFQGITHPISSPTWRKSGLSEDELKKLKNKVGFLKPTKYTLKFWKETIKICNVLNSPVCIIQLPKSFKDVQENLENAKTFFSKIRRNKVEIAIELRGWKENNIKKLCKEFELIDCCDPFLRLPTYITKKKIAYFRLHGSPPGKKLYNYKYKKNDLLKLKKIIKKIKAKKTYVFFNNIWMYKDSLKFKKMLGA